MSRHESHTPHDSQGLAGMLAKAFVDSKLTPLFILASVLLGLLAVSLLPREEEPQIKVPMVDVMVGVPGFSAEEVEKRVTAPMEKLIWEIPGVEYVYSISQPEEALVIVRFLVGEDVEKSLVKLNQKLQSNFDRIPPGVSFPLLKSALDRRCPDSRADFSQLDRRSLFPSPDSRRSRRTDQAGEGCFRDEHDRRAAPSISDPA